MDKEQKNLVSVLVNSCDRYEDAWNPFFYFFRKHWGNCPYKVYLNTESKKCNEDGVITLNSNASKLSWSSRLKLALKAIKSEYIIFLLEDFFLLDDVNQEELNRCVRIMDNDKKISVIDFEYCERVKISPSKCQGYGVRDLSSMYFLNCQSSIWRRKDLIKFLSPYESPWQFEFFGSDRAKLYNKIFLTQCKECNPVFIYNVNWDSGYGLHGGKWLKSNVDFFAKNGIDVDFSKLGFYEHNNVNTFCPKPPKTLKWRILYFLYGGGEKYRMSIWEQVKFFVRHPRKYLSVLKRKIIFLFGK